ncbi:MAG TPA: hypothetical protein VHJ82_05715 [Actinomycetota bacterium]|nr:hypothetical protein [Actinomycetota bacterium]
MKRAVFFLTLFSVLSLGPVASAQVRDPFDPLVVPGGAGGPVTAPQDGTGAQVDPASQVPSDRLADTGFDPAPYLVVAYALLVCGGAAIFLSWGANRRGQPPARS